MKLQITKPSLASLFDQPAARALGLTYWCLSIVEDVFTIAGESIIGRRETAPVYATVGTTKRSNPMSTKADFAHGTHRFHVRRFAP